jgi:bidirectional [NiFe] hydrogenase diaphorase subunit
VSTATPPDGSKPSGNRPTGAAPIDRRFASAHPGCERLAPPPSPGRKAAAEHPSGDDRFKMLDATMKRHRFAPDALIEVLHTAQELFGFLQPDLLFYIAHALELPPSRVYGVATFYRFFSFVPKGEHTCVVCTGTACYVKGADRLLAAIEERVGTVPGKTTADGRVSLQTARCLGTCGLAPVVVFDGRAAGNQSPETALEIVKGWAGDGSR